MKIKTSQIPEHNSIKKKKFNEDEEQNELDNHLTSFELDEEKKTYFKTFISFPETGQLINASYIQSIEKSFRLKESTMNFEATPLYEYGILINIGVTSGMNSPKADIELWYKNEDYRDQRYYTLLDKLDKVGIKIITI